MRINLLYSITVSETVALFAIKFKLDNDFW